ncbi:hypothetical protein B9Z55_025388 [Caenorhabditis nigoni]|uniref:Uncharacterized protein n=2 Tax=Caenorhabditis nigoni TaxID=1611254 RepID=A0A2G5SYF7_9PELO|nr:hypothetical protein B9Z55_025388 [Caenorhabditis nigoni]
MTKIGILPFNQFTLSHSHLFFFRRCLVFALLRFWSSPVNRIQSSFFFFIHSFIHLCALQKASDNLPHLWLSPFASVNQSIVSSSKMMHLHRNDLLTIESTSASKPSLLSSFWSINVQVQNNERLEDPKTCSQFSLPEVAAGQGENQTVPNQRPTRSASVTELSTKFETTPSSSELPASFMTDTSKDLPLAKETASCRVADWLTNLDINK